MRMHATVDGKEPKTRFRLHQIRGVRISCGIVGMLPIDIAFMGKESEFMPFLNQLRIAQTTERRHDGVGGKDFLRFVGQEKLARIAVDDTRLAVGT